jgi:hypothetical protein
VYEGARPSDVFIAQLTNWDTPEDAREFYNAYIKRTLRRYPAAKPSAANSQPENPDAKVASQAWQTSEGGVVVELRDDRVLIAEGIPGNANSANLIRTLWR